MPNLIDDRPTDIDSNVPASNDKLARQEAIKQIERRRRFRISAVASGIGMLVLVAIWAMTEYHNAGGWPVNGFSQSSGIHDVWNFWIVYPVGAWLAILAAHGWYVHQRKPIRRATSSARWSASRPVPLMARCRGQLAPHARAADVLPIGTRPGGSAARGWPAGYGRTSAAGKKAAPAEVLCCAERWPVRHRARLEVVEAGHAQEHVSQDQHRPPLAHDLEALGRQV